MAKYKLQFPYLIVTTVITPEDLDNHPDPRVVANVRDALGPLKFKQWVDEWVDGADNPVCITSKVHIKQLFTDHYMRGVMIGLALNYLFAAAAIVFLAKGAWVVGKFLFNMMKEWF